MAAQWAWCSGAHSVCPRTLRRAPGGPARATADPLACADARAGASEHERRRMQPHWQQAQAGAMERRRTIPAIDAAIQRMAVHRASAIGGGCDRRDWWVHRRRRRRLRRHATSREEDGSANGHRSSTDDERRCVYSDRVLLCCASVGTVVDEHSKRTTERARLSTRANPTRCALRALLLTTAAAAVEQRKTKRNDLVG